jgi:GTP-binding protein YchF
MGFSCGIVGLPNVGKSTLFNALTATAAAEAANYPFCTIEPNIGRVGVPDIRLEKLANIASSAKLIPTAIEFVDIAGLVEGASKGEGLGNQFLSHIREVDAIVQVLRCFDDTDITHVSGSVDPIRDFEIIETELVLADLEGVERRIVTLEKKAKSKDPIAEKQLPLLKAIYPLLAEGLPARTYRATSDEQPWMASLQLLTTKPMMLVCNVAEEEAATGNHYTEKVAAFAKERGYIIEIISSKIEAEISLITDPKEKHDFLEALGLEQSGLDRVISKGYGLLALETFFTIGPKEARAWTMAKGTKAPEAAGVIHTDFQKGFIRAETIAYTDYIEYSGEKGAKDAGRMRLEGKEYVVQDGDVMHFRFNV